MGDISTMLWYRGSCRASGPLAHPQIGNMRRVGPESEGERRACVIAYTCIWTDSVVHECCKRAAFIEHVHVNRMAQFSTNQRECC